MVNLWSSDWVAAPSEDFLDLSDSESVAMASSASRLSGSSLRLLKHRAELPPAFLALLSSASAARGGAAVHSGSGLHPTKAAPGSALSQQHHHASTHAGSPEPGYRVAWDYRGQRQILPIHNWVPDVFVNAFVAPNAVLAGHVEIQDSASVWYGSVLRGDLNKIVVGFRSSVGDKCVIHAAESTPTGLSAATTIGRYCTIGPYCTIRSSTIENEAVVGQSCVLMEGSLVEKHSFLGDGSVLAPGRRIPSGELWAGNPARYVRDLLPDEIAGITDLAEAVHEIAQDHASQFLPYSTAYVDAEQFGLILPVDVPV